VTGKADMMRAQDKTAQGSETDAASLQEIHGLYDNHCCRSDQTLLYGRPMVARRMKGCRVWFCGEREPYIDLVCGYSATNLGHCHPRLQAKLVELAGQFDQVHSLTSEPAVRLAGRLCGLMGEPDRYRACFTVGGAAAVDMGVRLCRAFSGRPIVASLAEGFHGHCLGVLPLTDPAFVATERFAPPACRRLALPLGDVDGCRRILSEHRGDVGGVIVEAAQGAAGFVIPPDGFLASLRELCRELAMLFIADEIQVGLGRAGRMLAIEHAGVRDADIVLLGKSLAGGYYPLSAVIARREVFDRIPAAGSTLGDTFSHSPIGCALALEVMDILERSDVIAQGCTRAAEMLAFLESLQKRCPRVARVWCIGAALGLEVAGGEPAATAQRLVLAGLDQHVLLYAVGPGKNRLKFAPPLTITAGEMSEACGRIARAFQDVVG